MKKIRSKFGEFEFNSYYITDPSEAKKVISKLYEADFQVGGLDLETAKIKKYKVHPKAGLCPLLSEIRLLQIYTGKSVFIFDLRTVPIQYLANLLYAKRWYAHYAIFEIAHLTRAGLPDLKVGCSQLLSKLLYTAEHSPFEPTEEEEADIEDQPDGLAKYKYTKHSLEEVTGRYFGIRLDKTLQKSEWGAAELSTEQLQYAAADAVMTYKIGFKLYEKVKSYGMEKHYSLLMQMQHVVADMQLRGFPVDWKLHEKFVNKWDDEQSKASRQCYGYFKDINLNSTKQLGSWLEKHLRRDLDILKRWPKTSGGKKGIPSYSFSAPTLANFKKLPAIKYLLEYKQYSKLLNTYGESFADKKHPITGRIHADYTLAHTRTGRLSAYDPNLQQWPSGESRSVFTPSSGKMVVADFSQIEVRYQAEISLDPVMRRVFKENRDIYCEFGSYLYERKITKDKTPDERQFSKVVILSMAYGMGAATLAKRASIELDRYVNENEAFKAWQRYRKLFKRYIEWCDESRSKAKQLGYVRTKLGKVRKLLENEVYTKAPNTEVQGGSAEIMMIALIKMRKAGLKLIGSIHDESLCETNTANEKDTIHKVNEAMNGAWTYMFPKAVSHKVAEAHAGKNWLEAKG